MKSAAEFDKWRALWPAAVTVEAKATRLLEVGLLVAGTERLVAEAEANEANAAAVAAKSVEAARKAVEAVRKGAEAERKAVEAYMEARKRRALRYEKLSRDGYVLGACDDASSGDEFDL